MNVLIVDDDPTSRLILDATLKKGGHQVTATKNGADALAAYEQGDFPLIISDMVMPGMDGLELCRRVRAANQSHYTYIILLTSVSGKYGYLVGMRAGADDFIAKPFDEELLAARLVVAERIFNLHSQRNQLDEQLCMCPLCRKVRDDQQDWRAIESYISERTGAKISKGYCPDCAMKVERKNLVGSCK